jgi:hypothetical protein
MAKKSKKTMKAAKRASKAAAWERRQDDVVIATEGRELAAHLVEEWSENHQYFPKPEIALPEKSAVSALRGPHDETSSEAELARLWKRALDSVQGNSRFAQMQRSSLNAAAQKFGIPRNGMDAPYVIVDEIAEVEECRLEHFRRVAQGLEDPWSCPP